LEPLFPNGHIASVDNNTYTPFDSVTVICDVGVNAESLNTTCNQSRLWDPQPVCTVVMCPAPVVDNGNLTTGSDFVNQESPIAMNNDTTKLDNESTISNYAFNTKYILESLAVLGGGGAGYGPRTYDFLMP